MLKNILLFLVTAAFFLNNSISIASGQNGNNSQTKITTDNSDEDLKDKNYNDALEIKDVWARASIPSNSNSAAYFTITNNSKSDFVIISANTSIANNVELHNSFVDEKGVSRMTSIDRVVIPAGGTIKFQPGGLHVMLFN